MFGRAYEGRRVLVTGHTGFKGSWLALWLESLGARVCGLALPPETAPNHWSLLGLGLREHHVDVRDAARVRDVLQREAPEIVFHLAAQSLVRRSYRAPLDTWATNVIGTANVLEACRELPDLKAVVVVTTDKVYENRERTHAYREDDALGGHDPYSASKAACELVVASYRRAFLDARGVLVASARAGNVIGGGDWSEDRLIPDLVRAIGAGEKLLIRSPDATRPWQHVLECLAGYLQLGQRLLGGARDCARAWNFGPDEADNRRVAEVLERLRTIWPAFAWTIDDSPSPHEAGLLGLDNSSAKAALGWKPVWTLDEALRATADWYRAQRERGEVLSRAQLADYAAAAHAEKLAWSAP